MNIDTIDYDSMDDDAFIAASNNLPISSPTEEQPEDDNQDLPTNADSDTEVDSDEDTQSTEDDTGDLNHDVEDDTDDEDDTTSENTDTDTENHDGDKDTVKDTEDDDFDFEAGYKSLLAPFKANGSEMQVDNIDDARRLMQQGAGANKAMLKLKPHLKMIKSLKDNNLLDQDRLDHLIELSQGNPAAIARLLKDSNVDPLDIDTENTDEYKPKNHSVSDSAYDLDQVIDSIRETETFDKSMNIMGEQWDQRSRETIAENPQIVNIVNDHVQSGVYDTIQSEVDKERALGRLSGISDVDAYREAAKLLYDKGVLVDGNNSTPGKNANPLSREADSITKKASSEKTKSKKRAAAPSGRGKGGNKVVKDLSGLSDEEFLAEFAKL